MEVTRSDSNLMARDEDPKRLNQRYNRTETESLIFNKLQSKITKSYEKSKAEKTQEIK